MGMVRVTKEFHACCTDFVVQVDESEQAVAELLVEDRVLVTMVLARLTKALRDIVYDVYGPYFGPSAVLPNGNAATKETEASA